MRLALLLSGLLAECPSIHLAFADAPGDGVPITGQDLTAMNCPDLPP